MLSRRLTRKRRRRPIWAAAERGRWRSAWWLLPIVAAAIALGVSTAIGTTVREAAPLAATVALIAFGAVLAISSSPWRTQRSDIGRGLFVSGVLALALLWVQSAQNARTERRQDAQDARLRRLEIHRQREADRRDLQLTIGMRRDLRGIDLRGRDLHGFYMASKDLRDAQLDRADARRANFSRTRLSEASLDGVDFRDARMAGVRMRTTQRTASVEPAIVDADLSHTELVDARLIHVRGNGLSFARADLSRAKLDRSEFDDSSFREADLREASAERTSFSHSDFRRARMAGISLRRAVIDAGNLRGADLCDAALAGAELTESDLRGADLRQADLSRIAFLTGVHLRGALFDSGTRWPAGFDAAARGAVRARTRHCQRSFESFEDLFETFFFDPAYDLGDPPCDVVVGPREATPEVRVTWFDGAIGASPWPPASVLLHPDEEPPEKCRSQAPAGR